MIKSMTGFGKVVSEFDHKKITIEIRSLNSKQTDINTRIPSVYREKDMAIRTQVSKSLERGKIDVSILVESLGSETTTVVNYKLALGYYRQLKQLALELDEKPENMLGMVIKMPDVMRAERESLDEQEWKVIEEALQECLKEINNFRKDEGRSLETDVVLRINNIEALLAQIEVYDPMRIQGIKDKISEGLETLIGKGKYDENRFEQELIYYIEKIDISEEKVRLITHLNYFREVIKGDQSNGKKLGFIAQELGREINTIGSKANYADIQKLVIQMKDDLEKIKEQVLNIL